MRKASVGVSAALLLVVIGAACFALWHVESSLKTIRQQVDTAGNLPFDLLQPAPLTPIFEPVAPPDTFTTGIAYAGKLYLAGPGGLATYAHPSDSPTWQRTGQTLPPAPIVALATARLHGGATPNLLAATQGEGLLIFQPDGTFHQLRPRDPANRDITAILPLSSGDILIGTRHAGLLIYDGTTLKLFQTTFANVPVTALAGDESDIWIGTRTQGLLHWHAGQLDTIDQTASLPDQQISDIAIDSEGVFAATPLGVAQLTNGHLARVLGKGLFARSLAIDGNTLLVATLDQGLHEISLKDNAPSHAILSNDNQTVSHFFTVDGTLLAVKQDSLLRHEHGGSWQEVLSSPPQSLADRNIAALNFSPDGHLWIGYFDRGLDVLNLTTNKAEHVEDDHIFCVNRIMPDPQRHTMDVATANGLVLFDPSDSAPKQRQILTRKNGLISDQITDVAFSNIGMTLATPAGLTYFTPSGPQSLYTFQGLANSHVYALSAQPDNDRVFAGTLGGISILDHGAIRQNVTLSNSGLKRNWITAILRVPQPNAPDIWFVGTYGGGVIQVDAAGHVSAINGALPSAVINPNSMLQSSAHIFVGSLDDGLLIYNRSTQHWSQITAGLPSRNVTALTERNGELYIGTENGIVRVAETRLP